MSAFEDNRRSEPAGLPSERSFALVWTAVLSLAGLAPLLSGQPPRIWALAAAAIVLAIGCLRPSVLRPANWLWTQFGLLLGRITTPIVTAVLFYGIFTPFGALMSVFRRDPLRLRWNREAESYWISRDPDEPSGESMRNQF